MAWLLAALRQNSGGPRPCPGRYGQLQAVDQDQVAMELEKRTDMGLQLIGIWHPTLPVITKVCHCIVHAVP